MKQVHFLAAVLCVLCAAPAWAAAPSLCPCASDPAFADFLDGSRALITCTDDSPFYPFVRVDAADFTLAVVTAFAGLGFACGTQPPFGYTQTIAISQNEFDTCRQALTQAAKHAGLQCRKESWPGAKWPCY